jgi:hypothetical protein
MDGNSLDHNIGKIFKAGVILQESELDGVGGAIALFCDNRYHTALPSWANLVEVKIPFVGPHRPNKPIKSDWHSPSGRPVARSIHSFCRENELDRDHLVRLWHSSAKVWGLLVVDPC